MTAKPRRRHTAEFQANAVRKLSNPGQSVQALADELEVRPSLIYRWRRAAQATLSDWRETVLRGAKAELGGCSDKQPGLEARRIRELERELARKDKLSAAEETVAYESAPV